MDKEIEKNKTRDKILRIRSVLEKYLNNKDRNHEDSEDYREAIRLMVGASEYLINDKGEIYENVETWKNILRSLDTDSPLSERSTIDFLSFIYMCSRELSIINPDSEFPRKALISIDAAHEQLGVSNSEERYYSKIYETKDIYENSIRYKLIEERTMAKFNNKLVNQVRNVIQKERDQINEIKKGLETNRQVLESIESESGLTSVFSGMKEYSKNIKGKLRSIKVEINNIKYLLFFTPVVSAIFYLTVDVHYGFFLSTLSIMVVLGYFLKVCLRKEDQYEQMLSKVENKIAITIFHKYHMDDMGERESEIANEKFHSMLYKDLETSEWNAPDLTESLVSLIKEIRAK